MRLSADLHRGRVLAGVMPEKMMLRFPLDYRLDATDGDLIWHTDDVGRIKEVRHL